MRKLLFSISLALAVASATAFAQTTDAEQRDGQRKTAEYQIGLGGVNILDTYLSPLEYTGANLRFISTVSKGKNHWTHLFRHEASFSTTENPAKTADELAGDYRFSYGLLRDIAVNVERLSVRAGGTATLNTGFLYNTRNSNNPAQGRLGLRICPTAQADYSFRLLGKPFTLRYEAAAPLCGLMFSPNYGQSYYEIFTRGDYDHNCVPTTVFSTPSLRHSLTLDFKVCGKTLSIGYLGDYDQYKVNNLKHHSYTHAVVIGYKH